MKNVICVCLCLLLLGSCSDKQGELGYPVLKVSLNEQDVSMKDLFSRLEVIPLETNDSSLLVFPDKVLCRNGRYEVFDHKRYALFLFDENGRFIRQVGRRDKVWENIGKCTMSLTILSVCPFRRNRTIRL